MESTDIACASSAVDSPAAGIATSPKVIVVSALDPDVILCVRHRANVVGKRLRLITCVRAWYTLSLYMTLLPSDELVVEIER